MEEGGWRAGAGNSIIDGGGNNSCSIGRGTNEENLWWPLVELVDEGGCGAGGAGSAGNSSVGGGGGGGSGGGGGHISTRTIKENKSLPSHNSNTSLK